ncbi:DUF2231 domain-containing protein [Sphaerisporangium corydalis]|uniref:DUF2231 domain-containing protein n=1 Tax=Sphaerisporangium corydalis TaxID=1441875 RepID=A0ABV9E739_9ACTN|nr:DUF2231 domain-containing protein [Sphaerisporangium corydalis]
MFDEILGLPAHPLIIHAAVIFIPLLALGSIVYGVVPRVRPRLSWAVVLLAIVAPVSAFAARASGQAFADRQFGGTFPKSTFGQRVSDHQSYATPLLLSVIGLGVAALLLVYSSLKLGKVTTGVLSAVTVVLALVAGFYVLQAGHTGAIAVWAK